jgi:methyl-accepting chemotaxis protein
MKSKQEMTVAARLNIGFGAILVMMLVLAMLSIIKVNAIEAVDESVSKIDTGAALVETAGRTMRDFVASVEQVTGMVGAITTASKEQHAGIEEVNRAIALMDQVTQQNAVLVEQAATSVKLLQEEAGNLNFAVSVFKTERSGHLTAWFASPARAPRPTLLGAA